MRIQKRKIREVGNSVGVSFDLRKSGHSDDSTDKEASVSQCEQTDCLNVCFSIFTDQ